MTTPSFSKISFSPKKRKEKETVSPLSEDTCKKCKFMMHPWNIKSTMKMLCQYHTSYSPYLK